MSFKTRDLGPGFLVSAEYVGATAALMELIESGASIEVVREINKRVRKRYDEKIPKAVHSAFGIYRDEEAA